MTAFALKSPSISAIGRCQHMQCIVVGDRYTYGPGYSCPATSLGAPPAVEVVTAFVSLSADRLMSFIVPVIIALFSIFAADVLFDIFRATEAPIPRLPPRLQGLLTLL
jgi:hypothetical protein